jgi:murein L,D-transpeptidase YafK
MQTVVGQTFLEKQKSNERVKTAYKEKSSSVESLLMASKLTLNDLQLFIRIFKQEKTLEVWGKKKNDTAWKMITSYPLCATSGKLGPKRTQGDEQMPEGFYFVARFNPTSNYYLSLGIDYPNASDLKFSKNQHTGDDIFIHGNCVTIGCFPIGDDAIKELYIMAIEATAQSKYRIPVHIFPCKMNESNIKSIEEIYPQYASFWKMLKPVYDYFESSKKIPLIRIAGNGNYEVAK